jgi:hypothetical protein
VRYDVGLPPQDLEPGDPLAGLSFRMIWSPIAMERPDGSRYGIFLHYQIFQGPGFVHKHVIMGGVESPDGAYDRFADLEPELSFDPVTRRLRGGRIHATTADGSTRTLGVEVVSDTGFHLGAGLYFGFDGHHHGQWLHQIRDTVIHVTDPSGGGQGWGNCQPIITGGDDALGLSADDSFM